MARKNQNLEINTFVKGLVTEASPLNFPDNASLEEKNFVLNRDGSRQRRLGMDFEAGYSNLNRSIVLSDVPDLPVKSFIWENPNRDGTLEIAVIQVGHDLFFYNAKASAISSAPLNSGNSFTLTGPEAATIEATSIQGYLILSTGTTEVARLTYDYTNDEVTGELYQLSIRDLFGIDDGLTPGERPTSLSDAHEYNLSNQGWPVELSMVNEQEGSTTPEVKNPVTQTFADVGFYPSNEDQVHLGKTGSAEEPSAVDAYSPWELLKSPSLGTLAPRGSEIIGLFKRGEDRGPLTPQDETRGSVSSVAAYSGRIFYGLTEEQLIGGDSRSPRLGTYIMFSQTIAGSDTFPKCYQEGDPTVEDIGEVVATDGGYVVIPEAGKVLALAPLGSSLYVLATNGVWAISGGETGFSATDQQVDKVTSIGPLTASSVMSSESFLTYWSSGGIYSISVDNVTLKGTASNLTDGVIQSFYQEIPSTSKANAVAVYDQIKKQIRWLYSGGQVAHISQFDRELIFDVGLQAFYTNKVDPISTSDGPYLSGYIPLAEAVEVDKVEDVVSEGVTVTSAGIDVTVTEMVVDINLESAVKYLTSTGSGAATDFTFSTFSDIGFADWVTYDGVGVDAEALMLTGYMTGGAISRDKIVTHLVTHLERTETSFIEEDDGLVADNPSSCLVQAQWAWTNTVDSGRWGKEFQAYRLPRFYVGDDVNDPFSYGHKVISSRSKLRGKGEALSLQFKSEPGKDLRLLGWGLSVKADDRI